MLKSGFSFAWLNLRATGGLFLVLFPLSMVSTVLSLMNLFESRLENTGMFLLGVGVACSIYMTKQFQGSPMEDVSISARPFFRSLIPNAGVFGLATLILAFSPIVLFVFFNILLIALSFLVMDTSGIGVAAYLFPILRITLFVACLMAIGYSSLLVARSKKHVSTAGLGISMALSLSVIAYKVPPLVIVLDGFVAKLMAPSVHLLDTGIIALIGVTFSIVFIASRAFLLTSWDQ